MARTRSKIDETYLRRLALWYLERWDAPRAGVRRALVKRIDRSVEAHGLDREACLAQAEAVLDALAGEGLIDDARFAASTVARLAERGTSRRRMVANLLAKGVDRDLVEDAIGALPGAARPERLAAIRYARRRRLGPWRTGADPHDAERRRKDLAAMARAGFDYGTATAVLDAPDADALEDELPRGW